MISPPASAVQTHCACRLICCGVAEPGNWLGAEIKKIDGRYAGERIGVIFSETRREGGRRRKRGEWERERLRDWKASMRNK